MSTEGGVPFVGPDALKKIRQYWDQHPAAKKPWTWIPPKDKKPGRWVTPNGDTVPVEALLAEQLELMALSLGQALMDMSLGGFDE